MGKSFEPAKSGSVDSAAPNDATAAVQVSHENAAKPLEQAQPGKTDDDVRSTTFQLWYAQKKDLIGQRRRTGLTSCTGAYCSSSLRAVRAHKEKQNLIPHPKRDHFDFTMDKVQNHWLLQ